MPFRRFRPQAPLLVVATSVVVVLAAGVGALVLHDDETGRTTASRVVGTTTTPGLDSPTPSAPALAPPDRFVPTEPPSYLTSTVAQATGPVVAVYSSPEDPQPEQTLENPQPSGAPLVFLVRDQQPAWLEVLLPVRPNGSTGWVRRADVGLTGHGFDIVVELRAHRLTLFQSGEVLLQEPVGIGTSQTPTPGGVYYIKELLKPPDPNTVYGSYAYGLSGFSNVLTSFEGGDGVIGLHGTNDPAGLGKDVSAGCIRMDNDTITRMVGIIPLGTPVEIRP